MEKLSFEEFQTLINLLRMVIDILGENGKDAATLQKSLIEWRNEEFHPITFGELKVGQKFKFLGYIAGSETVYVKIYDQTTEFDNAGVARIEKKTEGFGQTVWNDTFVQKVE